MSRKPIDQQQPTECRQAIWDEIRSKGDWTFAAKELDVMLDVSTIREYLSALANGGYLEVVSKGKRGESNVYRLVNDIGVDAPRLRKDGTPVTQGQGGQQMWRAMPIIKEFSIADLVANASTEDHRVAESEAKSYCQALCNAGYLVHQSGKSSASEHRYRLLPSMWTGPQPPQIQRTKQIYDPNLKKIVWSKIEGGAE